jgi:hypothetical protein
MMTAGLPSALVCASLGLALTYAAPKARIMAILCLVSSAFAAWALAPLMIRTGSAPFLASWACVGIAVSIVLLAREISTLTALLLATGIGVCAGVVVAMAGQPSDLFKALVLVLLMLPGTWLLAKGHQVVLKVMGSWLTAIAILSAALLFTPTAGYEPDHLE